MSEEIASADSFLTANAELRAALDVAMQENDGWREVVEQTEADYAAFRAVVRKCFAENGSEQSLLDLMRLASSDSHPGAALTIRFNRAKAVVEAARRALDACPFCGVGRCRSEAHEWLSAALAAYDAALKAGAK